MARRETGISREIWRLVQVGAVLLASAVGVSAAGPRRPLDPEDLRLLVAALLEEPPSARPATAPPAAPPPAGAVSLSAHAASARATAPGPPQLDVPRRPELHPVFGDYRGPKNDPPASPHGPKD